MTVVCCLPSNIYYVWVSFFMAWSDVLANCRCRGISGIIIDVLTLSSTFLLACFLGQKVFGLDKRTSWLIGAGSGTLVVLPRYWRLSR